MRHLKSGRKLSRRKNHRKAMLANLAVSLVKNDRIQTTDAKAKEMRPFVERMVTFAKRGDLHARRVVLSRLKNTTAVKKLFDEIGPRYTNRFGGYTRIIKLGFRQGDNSPISLIEFVKEDEGKKTVKKRKPSKAQAKTKPSKTSEKPVETAEVEEAKEKDTEAEITSLAEEKADNTEKPDDEIEDSGEEENKEKK